MGRFLQPPDTTGMLNHPPSLVVPN